MQLEFLWAFVVIFTIDSITPGPAVAMVMSRGASVGLFRTLPFIAGLVVGDLLLFCMALSGLAALAKSSTTLFFLVKWIGVGYLLYLAYQTWTAKPLNLKSSRASSSGLQSFSLAVLLPLGNPKAVGFYVALLPAFMDVETLTFTSAMHVSIAIVAIWSLVLIFYTYLADQGRRYFHETNAMKWLNRSAATAMVGAAGSVALRD